MSVLSTISRHEYYAELADALPPPVLDQPEYRQRRLTAAIETFEALRPGDAYEACLAVRIVLCGARAVEMSAPGRRPPRGFREDDPLLRPGRQHDARETRGEARAGARAEGAAGDGSGGGHPTGANRDCVCSAATSQTGSAAARPGRRRVTIDRHRAAGGRAASPGNHPGRAVAVPAGSAPPPSPEAIAKAEAFMEEHGVAAAQIRHDRGVTPQNKAYFRHVTFPTDPAVIDALIRGTSDLLTLLDEVGGETLDAAA